MVERAAPTPAAHTRAFSITTQKKKSLTRLTEKGFNVSDVQLTTDKKTVYYSLLDVSVPRPAHFGGEIFTAWSLQRASRKSS